MLQANGGNLVLGRGRLYFDRLDAAGASTAFRFVGNAESLTLSLSEDRVEKYSSVERGAPQIADALIRRTAELAFTLSEFTMENLALALMGRTASTSQASGTSVAFNVTSVTPGRTYFIGSFNVSAVTVQSNSQPRTLGTDFLLDTVNGEIYIVPGGGIAAGHTLAVTFTRPAITAISQMFGGSEVISGSLRFTSDNANGSQHQVLVPRVSLRPEGEVGLIGDDFGVLPLRGRIVKLPNQELFTITRLAGE